MDDENLTNEVLRRYATELAAALNRAIVAEAQLEELASKTQKEGEGDK